MTTMFLFHCYTHFCKIKRFCANKKHRTFISFDSVYIVEKRISNSPSFVYLFLFDRYLKNVNQ